MSTRLLVTYLSMWLLGVFSGCLIEGSPLRPLPPFQYGCLTLIFLGPFALATELDSMLKLCAGYATSLLAVLAVGRLAAILVSQQLVPLNAELALATSCTLVVQLTIAPRLTLLGWLNLALVVNTVVLATFCQGPTSISQAVLLWVLANCPLLMQPFLSGFWLKDGNMAGGSHTIDSDN